MEITIDTINKLSIDDIYNILSPLFNKTYKMKCTLVGRHQ